MALAAPARARRLPARPPARAAAPARRAVRLVEPRAPRARGVHRRAAFVACSLVVGSLLAIVAAHAYLTQGQVRLTRLQQQVAVQISEHRDLELRVAQLEDPSRVVAQAERQGLSAPTQVGDLAQVDVNLARTPPTTTNPVSHAGSGR